MTTIHTLPRNDLIEHDRSADCVCGPETVPIKREDGTVAWQVIHSTLDGREHEESDHDRESCPVCS